MIDNKSITFKQIFKNEMNLKSTYNYDLDAFLTSLKSKKDYIYGGVIMNNQIKTLPEADKLFAIINYDDSNEKGSHWVAFVKNGTDIYYFDSYGLSPLPNFLRRFPKRKYNISYIPRAIQLQQSDICGQLCLAFIKSMIKGKSFDELKKQVEKLSNRVKDDETPDKIPRKLNIQI